jgi:hypothetical protein
MKRLVVMVILLALFLPISVLVWSGDFAISCGNNSWPNPGGIAGLEGNWKFGGSGNDPASGSLSKVLTLSCVASPTLAGEISAGTFYFRIIHLEGSAWFSWGGDGSNDEELTLNDPEETVICPSGNHQDSKSAFFTATIGKDYQILFQANPNGANSTSQITVLEFDGNPATISSVSDNGPVNAGTDLTVTVTSSLSSPPADQKFWARYIYNDEEWSNSSFVGDEIGSGNSLTLNIPGKVEGGEVHYYVFTTESSITPTNSNVDRATLWLNGYTDNTYDTSLPVTLSSFTAKATKAGVLLEWSTSAEIENAGFVLRRMENGERNTGAFNQQSPIANQQLIASYLTDNALVGQGSVTKSTHYSFTDSKVEPGKSYVYTLSDVDFSGKETEQKEIKIKTETENAIIAEGYTLRAIYPNPFNASFTVPFSLNENITVKITLYNIAGQQVMTILNQELSAGEYHFAVNADDLSSGVYFVKTNFSGTSSVSQRISDRRSHTQKIVLMK